MLKTLEAILLLKLILELLAALTTSAKTVGEVMREVHSDDDTGTKVASIAESASHLLQAAAEIDAAAETKKD